MVAKQAAALDVLSNSRLRLGIGIGWNPVEYEALGENFQDRGKRPEEQVDLMRQLWTKELITYQGRWHKITDAGINPLPVQRPIPVWFGGSFRTCYETLGSNWRWLVSSKVRPRRKVGREKFEQVRTFAREAGRDPNEIGFEPRIAVSDGDPDTWSKDAAAWKELGATHLSVNTMGAGIKSPQGHIDAIIRFKEAIGMI